MVILKLLESSDIVESFDVLDYISTSSGFYIKIKVVLKNDSLLFIKQYYDEIFFGYSYHWQTSEGVMIIRWDNAPYHKEIDTFPHHQHIDNQILSNSGITLEEVLNIISIKIKNQ